MTEISQTVKVPSSLKVSLVTVTPKMAEKWLDSNSHNRAIRKNRVVSYARSMQNGEWEPAGDSAIIMDAEGNILNGQHRLAAVVVADTPQVFIVLRGVPQGAQEVMDRGMARSVADALKLRGEVNVNYLGGALRWLHRLDFIEKSGGMKPHYGGGEHKPTLPALMHILDENPGIRDSVKRCIPIMVALHVRVATPAIHYRCSLLSVEDTDDFFAKLMTGASTGPDDAMGPHHPIILLRSALLNRDMRYAGRRMPDYREAALMIKAWNYYRDGEEPKLLTWKFGGTLREEFPIPR